MKRIPRSYTVLAGGTATGLPTSVEKSPDVAAHRSSLRIEHLDAEQSAKQVEQLGEQAKKDAEAAKVTAEFLEEKRKRKAAGVELADKATDDAVARAAAENALRSQAESAAPAKRSKSA
jgi:hypothetical protein